MNRKYLRTKRTSKACFPFIRVALVYIRCHRSKTLRRSGHCTVGTKKIKKTLIIFIYMYRQLLLLFLFPKVKRSFINIGFVLSLTSYL